MKKIGALVFMLAGFGSFSAVHAEQFGTAKEARAMLDRAIAALNVNQARAIGLDAIPHAAGCTSRAAAARM
jgi:hypothetical protein